jgi:hypothetical protein
MKKFMLLISLITLLSGCVAVPVYDSGYDYPYYDSYPYGYVGPNVNLFFTNGHYGHGFNHGGGFHHGGGGFHGGGHWGGGRH